MYINKRKSSAARRVTAAILAAVVVLLSLPILTVPVSASPGVAMSVTYVPAVTPSEKTFSTGLSDNRWYLDRANMRLTYQGNWTAGCLDNNGFHPYTYANSSDKSWMMLDATSQWDAASGTIHTDNLQASPHGSSEYAVGYAYTAVVKGTVRLSLDYYSSGAAGDGFAVFCNKKMLWPTAGAVCGEAGVSAEWRSTSDISTISTDLAKNTYQVNQGDVISFVVKRGSGSGYHVFSPRVEYVGSTPGGGGGGTGTVTELGESTIGFQNENFPLYVGGSAGYELLRNMTGNWSFGARKKEAGSEYWAFEGISGQFCILNNGGGYGGDQWTYGGLYLQNGVVIAATDHASIFAYTVPVNGIANIKVDSISAEPSSIKEYSGEHIMFCICVNGTMIWPKKGGSFTSMSDWYDLVASDADAAAETKKATYNYLKTYEVEAGDRIEYCITTRSGSSMNTRDISFTVGMSTRETGSTGIEGASSALDDFYPSVSGNAIMAWNGRWQYAFAPRGTADFTIPGTIRSGRLLGGTDPADGYIALRCDGHDAALLTPGKTYDTAILYTIRYSGLAVLSVTAEDLTGSGRSLSYRVLVNGEERKSVTVDEYAVGDVRVQANVKPGDVVAFVFSLPEETAQTTFILHPRVEYASIADNMVVTGISMTPTSDLTVNFYVNTTTFAAPDEKDGLLLFFGEQDHYDFTNDEKIDLADGEVRPDGSIRYAYNGLAAKEMATLVYACPYRVQNDGTVVYGTPCAFSIAEYLRQLYGRSAELDTLITDTLVYGAAAQRYFNYETDRLATDGLTDSQRACGASGGALFELVRTVYPLTAGLNPLDGRIEGFSVIFGCRSALRIYYDGQNADGQLYLDVSDYADMRNAEPIKLRRADPYVDILLNAADIPHVRYFRLRCGSGETATYSQTVAYSPESYAAVMVGVAQDTGDVLLGDLALAYLRYGRSAYLFATK